MMNIIKPGTVSSMTTITKTTSSFYCLILILLSLFSFVSINVQNISYAHASSTLGESIQQFQENLQSSINKQIQSSTSNNNDNRCDGNNNISFQSQTNNNGKNTIVSENYCGDLSSIRLDSSSSNVNLKGVIVSTEYNKTTGIIVTSLFGNWSLTTKGDGSSDFESAFTKKPVFYDLTDDALSNTAKATQRQQQQQGYDIISYKLSNFNTNSIIQQNSDMAFKGKMDVAEERRSLGSNQPYEKNTFYNIDASISILNNRTLLISFDSQTALFDEFKDIPLVGLVIH